MGTVLKAPRGILHKIEEIEKEVYDLKLQVLKRTYPRKKVVSFKGIVKGVDISDEDFIEARKNLYGKMDD